MNTDVSHQTDPTALSLTDLGWSAFFAEQVENAQSDLIPMRVATVHRSRMSALGVDGPVKLVLPPQTNTSDYAVGDWVLVAPDTRLVAARLARKTLLQRRVEGSRMPQLISANVDTLFIVTSCNEDFNPARLERYLALANEAGTHPVIVLTKADKVSHAQPFLDQAIALQRDQQAVAIDAKSQSAADALREWCGPGQTVALIGSSGVGKSTLLNTLAAKTAETAQATGSIREDDAKGRHTTTSRSLHAIQTGGWVIDTPGMRSLHLSDMAEGLDVVFAEIAELAPDCKFRDCTHVHEPGCAVQAAVKAGNLPEERLVRWRKLAAENRENTPVQTGARGNKSIAHSKKR